MSAPDNQSKDYILYKYNDFLKRMHLFNVLIVFFLLVLFGCGDRISPVEPKKNGYNDQPIYDPYANMASKYAAAVDYTNPTTRDYAVKLAALSSGPYNIVQICEIYDYLYKNWKYVNDPSGFDYVSLASRTINANLAGDCDDYAVIMSAMIMAIGGMARVVIARSDVGGHAYAEVYMGNETDCKALTKKIREHYQSFWDWLFGNDPVGSIAYHKDSKGGCWVNLDWTSKFPGGQFFDSNKAIAISIPSGLYSIIQ
jgi:hypothetical protein